MTMNDVQDKLDAKKMRIDLGNDQSLNLEKEGGSGIWHVVIEHAEADKNAKDGPMDVHADKRSLKRELNIDQFKV